MNNSEAEAIVLGSLLSNETLFYTHTKLLGAHLFSDFRNKLVYKAIELTSEDKKIDIITVTDTLRRMNAIEKVGGPHYATELTNHVGTTKHFIDHVFILREASKNRRLVSLSIDIQDYIKNNKTSDEIVDCIHKTLTVIEDKDLNSIEGIQEPIKQFTEYYSSPEKFKEGMIPTGFKSIDNLINGFEKSDLVIIAGQSSMGKTAFAVSIIDKMINSNRRLYFLSLEMSKNQLIGRLLCQDSGVPIKSVRSFSMTEEQKDKMDGSIAKYYENSCLFIDDTSSALRHVLNSIRMMKAKFDIEVVVVDYLQLIQNWVNKGTREQEVSQVARSLKNLAKELNIVIVALSQLSRKPSERNDKRPILSDLRESGEIEQAADMVVFVYRDAYYNSTNVEDDQEVEIIVAKGRNTSTGTVKLRFKRSITKFYEEAQQGY